MIYLESIQVIWYKNKKDKGWKQNVNETITKDYVSNRTDGGRRAVKGTREREGVHRGSYSEQSTLTETIDALKAENATLKNDLINALKNSVVKSGTSPVNEIKTDAEIYAEWKEKVIKNE